VRILLVGMADSIHLSRWLAQFDDSAHVFEIVSSSPHRRIHQGIRQRAAESNKVSLTWFSRVFSLPLWLADRVFSDWLRGAYIALRIKRFAPDLVHVNELQNAGYATRRAYQLLRRDKPKLIVTNYGSEIVWFSKYPAHKAKLTALLSIADAFSAECVRDYNLAEELAPGLNHLPLMPVAGGHERNQEPEQPRKKIAIKGYENHWGKALTVLEVLVEMAPELDGYDFEFYSCNRPVIGAAKRAAKETGLSITTHKKGALSHQQVLSLFRQSEIYIGHSMSDGISTSMLEAMAMGAIPIQTCTSCADEWVIEGDTGFLVEPNDKAQLAKSIKRALSKDFNTEHARKQNYATIESRYSPKTLSAIAQGYYEGFENAD